MDASSSIELDEFERIEAVLGTALVRITARASAGAAHSGSLTLIVAHQGHAQRFPKLPAPPDPAGLLRAAFSVPLELLERPVTYELELSDGNVVELPAPKFGRRHVVRAEPEPEQLGRRANALSELQHALAMALAEAAEQRIRADELESVLATTREAAQHATTSAEASAQWITELEAAADAAHSEAAELNAAVASQTERADASPEPEHSAQLQIIELTAQLLENGQTSATFEAEAARLAIHARALKQRLVRAREQTQSLQLRVEELEEQVSSAQRQASSTAGLIERLEAQSADARVDAERTAARAAELQEALAALTAERNQLPRQLGEASSDRTELERRLADVVGELSIVTAARMEAESAAKRLAAELEHAHTEALHVARQFEHEAAAREDAERLVERVEAEHAQLDAHADELSTQLAEALARAEQAAASERELAAIRERARAAEPTTPPGLSP